MSKSEDNQQDIRCSGTITLISSQHLIKIVCVFTCRESCAVDAKIQQLEKSKHEYIVQYIGILILSSDKGNHSVIFQT